MTRTFDRLVTAYMTQPVETVTPTTPLSEVLQILQARRISSVAVVDPQGAPIGVVSRTDLIKLGAHQVALRGTTPALPLPNHRTAGEVMTPTPKLVSAEGTLREAARAMIDHAIHRLFVVDGGRLVGVISTLDLATAVYDARLETPLSAWMVSPVVMIGARMPIAAGIDLLDRLHVSAVVVIEDGWPVGMFSQVEALIARDLPRDTLIETVMDTALICLPESLRVHRAAAHAAQLDVRRVVAIKAREIVGILSGLDFARIVAE